MSMNSLPDIQSDFAQWYQEVIHQAELVDQSPVRGSMVIRPYGYAIWEHIRDILNKRIKETGHKNAAFPLLIPESFLKKEAEHVEGFAPELAVVTYAGGKKLEDPLVIRPTSETLVHAMFARWISSWRDLPLKINQWANVVRWEMRPRAFLRTTEFFWQEGHTAHEAYEEALNEAHLMMQEYVNLATNKLAIPVITGKKTESEKFPGAEMTLTFEAIMQDGKALQMGTSHLLSQGFARAFNMAFQDREGKQEYPHLTSWGVTTRLVGAVVMVHGDQKGLVIPPQIAPIQVIIVPIFKKGNDSSKILEKAREIEKSLQNSGLRVEVDSDEHKTPGAKFYKWELRGVPIRIELGPRDIEKQQAVVVTRLTNAKETVSFGELSQKLPAQLEAIQQDMLDRATKRLQAQWHKAAQLADFGPTLMKEGGIYQTGWCQSPACEQELKKYKAFTRCLLDEKTFETCFACDKPSVTDVLVAKAY